MKQHALIVLAGAAGLLAAGKSSWAALAQSSTDPNPLVSNFVDDGAIGFAEYAAGYTNGGGTGFGGTLGNSVIFMDADATNLYIGFDPGADLNDIVALQLDTRAGGFTDAQSNDTSDGGRRAVSNMNGSADDAYPVLPDFGLAIANFGMVLFEHTNGPLNFHIFQGDQTGNSPSLVREFAIPLALLGNPTVVNFFAGYVADSGFGSNESLPASAGLNGGGNIGDGTSSPGYENYNQFVIVPEPAMLGLFTMGGLALLRRRGR